MHVQFCVRVCVYMCTLLAAAYSLFQEDRRLPIATISRVGRYHQSESGRFCFATVVVIVYIRSILRIASLSLLWILTEPPISISSKIALPLKK